MGSPSFDSHRLAMTDLPRILGTLSRPIPAVLLAVAIGGLVGCVPPIEPRGAFPLEAHPGRCTDCHTTLPEARPEGWRRPTPPRDLTCAECHRFGEPSVGRTGPLHVHAPVALGECGTCHTPHASPFPHLLRGRQADLCGSCHATLRTCPSVREPGECGTCHDPHSSTDARFLRGL